MTIEKILIPDFGDVQEITVVEVFIGPGDSIEKEASVIALESEKAVMDIPSPFAGVIKELLVAEDDVVASGDIIALIEVEGGKSSEEPVTEATTEAKTEIDGALTPVENKMDSLAISHATPSVRAFAREQNVDLFQVTGSGPYGRILKEDVEKKSVAGSSSAIDSSPISSAIPVSEQGAVEEDFSSFGEVEEVALGRIQKISGSHLHKSWVSIPHVTHFDEADISGLESFRKDLNSKLGQGEQAYSPLVFVTKAVAATLKEFPFFNSSLMSDGAKVIVKNFYHIGIAVDTPNGLLVPVLKDVDKKGCKEIAAELKRLSSNAREGKLTIPDLQGATFTISSLGGIGGTGFTPIVSSPQVAILGLSRSYTKPAWDGEKFIPRLTLPFSVSYDHRVIDGAQAARFCKTLRENVEDLRRTLL